MRVDGCLRPRLEYIPVLDDLPAVESEDVHDCAAKHIRRGSSVDVNRGKVRVDEDALHVERE